MIIGYCDIDEISILKKNMKLNIINILISILFGVFMLFKKLKIFFILCLHFARSAFFFKRNIVICKTIPVQS